MIQIEVNEYQAVLIAWACREQAQLADCLDKSCILNDVASALAYGLDAASVRGSQPLPVIRHIAPPQQKVTDKVKSLVGSISQRSDRN